MFGIWIKRNTILIYFRTDNVAGTALSVHNGLTYRKVTFDKKIFDNRFLRNNLIRYETGKIVYILKHIMNNF